jgi:DNA-binding NarL/FixJ family response regulator
VGFGPEQASDGGLRVVVAQEHTVLAEAIARILEDEPDLRVCSIARSAAEAAAVALHEKAAVVLMDFHLPDMQGPAAANMIRAGNPGVAIVFHTTDDSEAALLDAVDAGAAAYLTKSATGAEIVEAVRRASRGEVLIPTSLFAKAVTRRRTGQVTQQNADRLAALLTPRELDVLRLMSEGLETNAMSTHLGVAPHTIEWHVGPVIQKLDVHSKLQAVIAAARLGLVDFGDEQR